jgi:hypothetical protein
MDPAATTASRRRWRPVAIGCSLALLVAVALTVPVGLSIWSKVSNFFAPCPIGAPLGQRVVDALAPSGFTVAAVEYVCSGSVTGRSDGVEIWLTSDRGFSDRAAMSDVVTAALTSDRWTREPTRDPHRGRLITSSPPDTTFLRDSFALDVWARSTEPAVVRVYLQNVVPRPERLDGPRLPERPLTDSDRLRFSLAPKLASASVPAGFDGWAPPAPLIDHNVDVLFSYLTPDSRQSSPHLRVAPAAPGLDLSTACSSVALERDTRPLLTCLRIGTTPNGERVYLPVWAGSRDPVSTAGGQQLEYGFPIAVIDSATVVLIGVGLRRGDVTVQGRTANSREGAQDVIVLPKADVVDLFTSLRFDPPAR